jgi:peroxiredoxin-like protein
MHTYDVNLKWDEARKGTMSSSVLNNSIEVVTPPEFPKGIEGIWSPEHYFVAAVNSCLMTTFLAIAENSKLNFKHFNCDATGTLDKLDGKFQMTEILLKPHVVIDASENADKAKRVIEMSEKACLISNSICSQVHLEPTISVAE